MYKTQRNYENAQRILFDGVGQYDIPELEPVQFDNAEFIGFNYARNAKEPENKAVHFFLDDYQFTRVWTDPDKYTAMLQRFKYEIKSISYYDKNKKRYKQIDTGHLHNVNGKKIDLHTHKGYIHDEKGTYEVSPKERKMIERVQRAWYYHINR